MQIISVTSPVKRNESATLKAKGTPGVEYKISVFYGSGASEASGLEKKTADSNGDVSWTWKIGGRTNEGTYPIEVSGGGEKVETKFTVEVD